MSWEEDLLMKKVSLIEKELGLTWYAETYSYTPPKEPEPEKEEKSEEKSDDELPESYQDWSLKQLHAEIDLRNKDRADDEKLSKSGNKADLVERLEEDDDEDQDEDE